MVKSWFLTLFIISALVSLSVSQGYGGTSTVGSSDIVRSQSEPKDGLRAGREMVEMVSDYMEPGPNTNPRGGFSNSPPAPPST